ncbi:hypothetical protein TNCV_3391961 [Trichonephila clavipes]|nr:hypothetical protein TNCV_3391961 [Trichonephila clavipes]
MPVITLYDEASGLGAVIQWFQLESIAYRSSLLFLGYIRHPYQFLGRIICILYRQPILSQSNSDGSGSGVIIIVLMAGVVASQFRVVVPLKTHCV